MATAKLARLERLSVRSSGSLRTSTESVRLGRGSVEPGSAGPGRDWAGAQAAPSMIISVNTIGQARTGSYLQRCAPAQAYGEGTSNATRGALVDGFGRRVSCLF